MNRKLFLGRQEVDALVGLTKIPFFFMPKLKVALRYRISFVAVFADTLALWRMNPWIISCLMSPLFSYDRT